jgi:hypothetical protein
MKQLQFLSPDLVRLSKIWIGWGSDMSGMYLHYGFNDIDTSLNPNKYGTQISH